MNGMATAADVTRWACQRCTLINDVGCSRCRACQFECPQANGRGGGAGLLQKIKLPYFSLSSAFEKIDSVVDKVAESIAQRNGPNVVFTPNPGLYPSPASNGFHQFPTPPQTSGSWTCPKCRQLNATATKSCAWCDAERVSVLRSCWICSNQRCGLRQPFAPPTLRCPLCRTKTSSLKPGHSKSMPHLSQPPQNQNQEPADCFLAGLAEESTAEHTQTYLDIMKFCGNNRQTFVDDSFAHSLRSVGSLSQLEHKNLNIVWFRPEQIVTRDGQLSRWAVFNDPQPTDIEQGLLGNCWFLSALAVVSERPDILDKLFLTKEYNHFGVYEMRICIDGVWKHILVDDFFPCHKRGRSMVFAVGRKNQLWVSLIEKALAKAYGNYAMMRAGRTVEGLSTLTGSPTLSIDLEYVDLNAEEQRAALDIAWAQLISAREARFLMGCSCGAGKRTVDEKEYRRVGLMSQHAYSILDVRQTSQGHRLVHLRNPWGTFVWLGEYSKRWSGWTPTLKEELRSDAASWPGTFWMPFERFAQFFDTVDIAQIREHYGWVATRYLVDIGWEEGKARVIRLIITEPTELCATLFQRNARTSLDQVDIMLLIHRQENDLLPGELVCRSPRRIQPLVRTNDIFLQPGEYLLCVHSFSKFADRMILGTVVIHSSKKIFTEFLPVSLDILHRSLCSLMLKEGIIQDAYSGTISRYLTNEFAGLALMIENNNQHCCVQVHSNCQDSTNVLSTRSSLLAVDSIPPLHRQIVTLLTHFEPSQSFMVGHRLVHRLSPHPQLRDFAPQAEFGSSQNFPPLLTAEQGALHGPRPIYN